MKEKKKTVDHTGRKKQSHVLGQLGEEMTSGYLESQGFRILERNYRCSHGEIDIVAAKDGYLFFVEVKTRRSREYGEPSEAVSRSKQQKIRCSAVSYLTEHDAVYRGMEFQVIEIQLNHLQGLSFRGVAEC